MTNAIHQSSESIKRSIRCLDVVSPAPSSQQILPRLIACLAQVGPKADEIDNSPGELRAAYEELGKSGMLALKRPAAWGSPEADRLEYFLAKLLVSRTSGALAFLFTQTGSAVGMIAASTNKKVQRRTLSSLHLGKPGLGIAYAHLRRRGNIPLRAERCSGGYVLNGRIPWVTGFEFFEEVVAGAEAADGSHILAMIPFQDLPGLTYGAPIPLASMEVTATCEGVCENFFLADEQVIDIRSPDWIEKLDESRILEGCAFVLGCASAGVSLLEEIPLTAGEPIISESAAKLREEYERLLLEVYIHLERSDLSSERQLRLRAESHNLSSRAALAAVAAVSGRANLRSHSAQRVYREALAWTVLAQSRAIREAQLKNLSRLIE